MKIKATLYFHLSIVIQINGYTNTNGYITYIFPLTTKIFCVEILIDENNIFYNKVS